MSSPCCAGGVATATPSTKTTAPTPPRAAPVARGRSTRGQRRLPGGVLAMGDGFDEGYPSDGEGPVHDVELAPFHLDETAVTNAAFAAFVRETGHVTDAEELGVSAVFHLAVAAGRADVLHRVEAAPWWLAVRGASWRHPEGPRSDVSERSNHPVVHVSWRDAAAYAAWAGKRLPTEAEWELGARGGLVGARYAWGDELTPGGRHRCNIWQGRFPHENTADDGFLTTAPVKSFRPNGLGLWNCSGNTWEWCADWFSPTYYAECAAASGGRPTPAPTGPPTGEARVMRGGSFLCHASYCHRYRVAARSSSTPESTSANVGFRCANDA